MFFYAKPVSHILHSPIMIAHEDIDFPFVRVFDINGGKVEEIKTNSIPK